MDLPADVLVHNPVLGLKGGKATLMRITDHGYYELNLTFGERQHRALLPIQGTVIIHRKPEEAVSEMELEIER
jgi:hypothetical protein